MQQLIQACKDGNVFAERRLYEHYVGRMFRVCLRYVGNEADAEEVMMDGFLKVFEKIKQFEYRDEISTDFWVKRIMVNEALQFIRKKKIFEISYPEDAIEVADDYNDAVANCDTETLYAWVCTLPDGYRTVFNLFTVEGFSHSEIAKQLNISEGTSKSQLSKARVLIQKFWKDNKKNGTL